MNTDTSGICSSALARDGVRAGARFVGLEIICRRDLARDGVGSGARFIDLEIHSQPSAASTGRDSITRRFPVAQRPRCREANVEPVERPGWRSTLPAIRSEGRWTNVPPLLTQSRASALLQVIKYSKSGSCVLFDDSGFTRDGVGLGAAFIGPEIIRRSALARDGVGSGTRFIGPEIHSRPLAAPIGCFCP
jgi:hypothetical protein